MDEELVIPGSRERFLWMLVMGLCFFVLGYWATFEGHQWLLGSAGMAMAIFGLAVTVLMMRPGHTYLRLDARGFELVVMRRRYCYAWSEVDGFYLCSIGGADAVGIAFNASCASQRAGRAIAEGLTGIEGGIANVFTAGPAEVCDILNAWKTRHDPTLSRESFQPGSPGQYA